jgi:hypothetical protein
MHRLKFTLALFPYLFALSTSAEISVTAIFNPPRVALGDKAQYVLAIKETDTSRQPEVERVTSLPIPQSGGLELTNGRTGTSQQTSIINGEREYSVTQQLIIDANAPRVGTFNLPTYVFQYKGQTLRAPTATLQVVERGADAGPTSDELIFLKPMRPINSTSVRRQLLSSNSTYHKMSASRLSTVSIEVPTASLSVNYPTARRLPRSSMVEATVCLTGR